MRKISTPQSYKCKQHRGSIKRSANFAQSVALAGTSPLTGHGFGYTNTGFGGGFGAIPNSTRHVADD